MPEPKNIIICCDGTGNQFSKDNSNVVKLYRVLEKTPKQVAYYDPGVGTSRSTGTFRSVKFQFRRLFDLMVGFSLYENVYEAYSFLMENYEEGDRVFLFGFSRGAYTLRVLAGFIKMTGLLSKGCQNMIPYAFELFSARKWDLAEQFKLQFAHPCPIHFLGIWDTVSSVGYFGFFKTYPYTANNDHIEHVRHAVAVDERRSFFSANLWGTDPKSRRDLKEVWFPGVHSDVGGSYEEKNSGLSKLSLKWMIQEASQWGLEINGTCYQQVLQNNEEQEGPNPHAKIHESLRWLWWLAEFIPRRAGHKGISNRAFYIPFGRNRYIPEDAYLHESVFIRKEKESNRYHPKNLPSKYNIEP